MLNELYNEDHLSFAIKTLNVGVLMNLKHTLQMFYNSSTEMF